MHGETMKYESNDEVLVCCKTSLPVPLKQILIVQECVASLLITCLLPHYMEQSSSREANRF